jgi:hypothetical protein
MDCDAGMLYRTEYEFADTAEDEMYTLSVIEPLIVCITGPYYELWFIH